jgi:hypothetical protein
VVGTQVEKLYGSARFLAIYLLSGVGGVAGSYYGQIFMNKLDVPSVGASGAIFGLFGVLAVFGFRYRREMPPAIRRAMTAGVLPVIVVNLFIGFSIPFIDNSAHIGGLLTGAALTLIIPYVAPGEERVTKTGLLIIALCLAVIGYCFAQAYQANRRSQAADGLRLGISSVRKAMVHALDPDLIDGAQGQKRESAVAKLDGAIEELQNARTPDAKSDRILQELIRIVRKQHSLLTSTTPEKNGDEIKANRNDYWRVLNLWDDWMETELRKGEERSK